MGIDDVFLTLLTPEGEFLRSKKLNQPYSIGEEIFFYPVESVKSAKQKNSLVNIFKLKTVWTAMAALMIFLGTFIPMYQDNKAYAYMSIDVNPSIELGVNKDMEVVELTGFNKEGKQIISQLEDWKKTDVSDLAKIILSKMKHAGYLTNKEQVVISTVRVEESEKKVEEELDKNIEEIEEAVHKEKLQVVNVPATKKDWNKSQKLGISVGQYNQQKNQSSLKVKNEQTEETDDLIRAKETAVPAQSQSQSKNIVPPGQLKKQTEGTVIQPGIGSNAGMSRGNSTTSPGQLKKMDENSIKKNQGQPEKKVQPPGKSKKQTNGSKKVKENNKNKNK
jgi:hypothetical protein